MPNRVTALITLSAINALRPGDVLNDTRLKGFMARRQKDTVSYILKTRVNGRQRWFTIGRQGHPWTPETARKRAVDILSDPAIAEKSKAATAIRTFAAVAEEFMRSHGPKLKRRSHGEYQRRLSLDLIPAFGSLPVEIITRAQVSTLHAKGADNPSAANYTLAVLSKIMSWAEDQGYRPEETNPCRRVQRYKENKRERFLTAEELGRLGAALDKAEAEHLTGLYALAAIRLLIFTGARLNEILTLQWSYVDLDRRMIFLPDSKTGQKPIHLNDPAVGVLTAVPRFANNPYVICGNLLGAHLVNLQKPWRVVRALAGLDGVRIHDLRHTFASVGVAQGGSLPMIGAILGHTQPQTTQRYSHLAAAPVRQLSQATGAKLAEALSRKPK